MKVEQMQALWPIAKTLHEARIALAWGARLVGVREPWPAWSSAYPHNPIAFVDLALAQAEAIAAERNKTSEELNILRLSLRRIAMLANQQGANSLHIPAKDADAARGWNRLAVDIMDWMRGGGNE